MKDHFDSSSQSESIDSVGLSQLCRDNHPKKSEATHVVVCGFWGDMTYNKISHHCDLYPFRIVVSSNILERFFGPCPFFIMCSKKSVLKGGTPDECVPYCTGPRSRQDV